MNTATLSNSENQEEGGHSAVLHMMKHVTKKGKRSSGPTRLFRRLSLGKVSGSRNNLQEGSPSHSQENKKNASWISNGNANANAKSQGRKSQVWESPAVVIPSPPKPKGKGKSKRKHKDPPSVVYVQGESTEHSHVHTHAMSMSTAEMRDASFYSQSALQHASDSEDLQYTWRSDTSSVSSASSVSSTSLQEFMEWKIFGGNHSSRSMDYTHSQADHSIKQSDMLDILQDEILGSGVIAHKGSANSNSNSNSNSQEIEVPPQGASQVVSLDGSRSSSSTTSMDDAEIDMEPQQRHVNSSPNKNEIVLGGTREVSTGRGRPQEMDTAPPKTNSSLLQDSDRENKPTAANTKTCGHKEIVVAPLFGDNLRQVMIDPNTAVTTTTPKPKPAPKPTPMRHVNNGPATTQTEAEAAPPLGVDENVAPQPSPSPLAEKQKQKQAATTPHRRESYRSSPQSSTNGSSTTFSASDGSNDDNHRSQPRLAALCSSRKSLMSRRSRCTLESLEGDIHAHVSQSNLNARSGTADTSKPDTRLHVDRPSQPGAWPQKNEPQSSRPWTSPEVTSPVDASSSFTSSGTRRSDLSSSNAALRRRDDWYQSRYNLERQPATTSQESTAHTGYNGYDGASISRPQNRVYDRSLRNVHQPEPRYNSRSQQSLQPERRRNHYSKDDLVQIYPGVYVPLRSAHETQSAIEGDYYKSMTCWGCQQDLFCIQDAAYMACPSCRTVSALDDVNSGHGLGLGFDATTLCHTKRKAGLW